MNIESIQYILASSELIEKALHEGDWEELNNILKKRQKALEVFFSQLNSLDKTAEVVALIIKIQKEDAVFFDLLKMKKQGLEKRFTALKQGRRSLKAYQI